MLALLRVDYTGIPVHFSPGRRHRAGHDRSRKPVRRQARGHYGQGPLSQRSGEHFVFGSASQIAQVATRLGRRRLDLRPQPEYRRNPRHLQHAVRRGLPGPFPACRRGSIQRRKWDSNGISRARYVERRVPTSVLGQKVLRMRDSGVCWHLMEIDSIKSRSHPANRCVGLYDGMSADPGPGVLHDRGRPPARSTDTDWRRYLSARLRRRHCTDPRLERCRARSGTPTPAIRVVPAGNTGSRSAIRPNPATCLRSAAARAIRAQRPGPTSFLPEIERHLQRRSRPAEPLRLRIRGAPRFIAALDSKTRCDPSTLKPKPRKPTRLDFRDHRPALNSPPSQRATS